MTAIPQPPADSELLPLWYTATVLAEVKARINRERMAQEYDNMLDVPEDDGD